MCILAYVASKKDSKSTNASIWIGFFLNNIKIIKVAVTSDKRIEEFQATKTEIFNTKHSEIAYEINDTRIFVFSRRFNINSSLISW